MIIQNIPNKQNKYKLYAELAGIGFYAFTASGCFSIITESASSSAQT